MCTSKHQRVSKRSKGKVIVVLASLGLGGSWLLQSHFCVHRGPSYTVPHFNCTQIVIVCTLHYKIAVFTVLTLTESMRFWNTVHLFKTPDDVKYFDLVVWFGQSRVYCAFLKPQDILCFGGNLYTWLTKTKPLHKKARDIACFCTRNRNKIMDSWPHLLRLCLKT